MSSQATRSTLDGLPKQFVASMRTLFDIMDDGKTGYVKFTDIESRWREEEGENAAAVATGRRRMPKGVIECLRKVTPPNGMLSFERFCAGLKICLLRNKSGETSPGNSGKPPLPTIPSRLFPNSQHQSGAAHVKKLVPSQSVPPTVTRPLVPVVAVTDSVQQHRISGDNAPAHKMISPSSSSLSSGSSTGHQRPVVNTNTATVRPTTVTNTPLRAVSMPLLGSGADSKFAAATDSAVLPSTKPQFPSRSLSFDPNNSTNVLRGYKSETKISQNNGSITQPQQIQQKNSIEDIDSNGGGSAPPFLSMARDRRGIMTALHNWHMGMLNELENKKGTAGMHPKNQRNAAITSNEHDFFGGAISDGDMGNANTKESLQFLKKDRGNSRRREPRRHTLANGIDYNMLKRMKQLEQEKDILLQGLESVDKARSWYLKQIVDVQDKMKYIGHNNNHLEYSTEAHQERLNFQMAQIFEVNQNLSALVESSERGFPLHMNLALRRQPLYARQKQKTQSTTAAVVISRKEEVAAVQHLKELNHLLSEEVSKKSDRISQLELEKAALVRELFQARSHVMRREMSGGGDTTLM